MCFDTNSQQYRTQGGACVHIMKPRQTESAPLRFPAPRARASGGRSIHRCFWAPLPAPRSSCFKRFVKWWPLANQASSKPLDDPVDGADKIIATCHALLKEKQPRDDLPRDGAAHHHRCWAVRLRRTSGKPGAYHRARWMAKVIYTLKSPSFSPREFALTKHGEEGADPVLRRLSSQRTWNRGCPPTARPRPGNGPRPPQSPSPPYRDKEIGRASGKGDGPGTCGTSPRSSSAFSLFDEATVVGRSGPSSAPCSSGWGEKNRLAAPTSPSTQWSSAPWVVFATTNLSASHRPRGARARFPQRRSRRVVVEGRNPHHGSSARPSPTGGERLCGEGRRPHQRVLRRPSRATRNSGQHLLQVVERHRALYPCPEMV
ncbi:hypothetical protein GWK47_046974 [Chionoecetes opilio]|uniref:Uncharacterized protein n=1 Tax=Chionoecetes opilio TaxID=41210 RepID=A0A8J5CWX6_CHIOP|nr:hypothetical protein GWK47_046974 [Chionoecetes opilio]